MGAVHPTFPVPGRLFLPPFSLRIQKSRSPPTDLLERGGVRPERGGD